MRAVGRPRIVLYVVRGLLLLWAGFWTWFVLMTLVSEGLGGWPYALRFLGPLAATVVVAWLWPRIGGLLLMLGAAFAAWYSDNAGARILLALPAALCGVACVLAGALATRMQVAADGGTGR